MSLCLSKNLVGFLQTSAHKLLPYSLNKSRNLRNGCNEVCNLLHSTVGLLTEQTYSLSGAKVGSKQISVFADIRLPFSAGL